MEPNPCTNCKRDTEKHGGTIRCLKCSEDHCVNCVDTKTGRCWKCEGVPGAYMHQREVAKEEA